MEKEIEKLYEFEKDFETTIGLVLKYKVALITLLYETNTRLSFFR